MSGNFLPAKKKGPMIMTPPIPVHTVNTSNGPKYIMSPKK